MPDCSAVAIREPSTLRHRMPPIVHAAMVARSAPIAAPSVGVKSDRPKKKSPFMPMKTTRKMPTTGQVSTIWRRRTLKPSLAARGALSGRTSRYALDREKKTDNGERRPA